MKNNKRKMLLIFVLFIAFQVFIPLQVNAAVKLNKTKATLVKGQTLVLKVKGTKKKVKWKSSKKSVATISSKGKVTAKNKGITKITAKVTGGKKLSCKITVETPSISKSALSLFAGNKTTLKISGTTQKISWSSSNNTCAIVNSKGVITGVKKGTVTITAKLSCGKTYKCKVTVKALPSSYSITDRHFEYSTSYGTTSYFAYVAIKNTGKTYLYLKDAIFDFEDDDGHLLETEKYISTTPDVIAPGETGYFYNNSSLDDSVSLDNGLNFVPNVTVVEATSTLPIECVVSDISVRDGTYNVSTLGRITNPTNKDCSYMYATVIYYNSSGAVIGITGTSVLGLEAGKTTSFEISGINLSRKISAEEVAHYRIIAQDYYYQY